MSDKLTLERAWMRSIFLAGVEFGRRDMREHPSGPNDPWHGPTEARTEQAFQDWLTSMVPSGTYPRDAGT